MKRFVIGIAVLSLLLGLGITVSALFQKAHRPSVEFLQQATQAALEGDWPRATALSEDARQQWERVWYFTAAFADHSPMDEIDALFARLQCYGQQKSREHFPALCLQLAQLTEAIADSHRLQWWTLL